MLRQAITRGLRLPAGPANLPQRRTAYTQPIQAPTLGWNARDSIANMKAGYAYRMVNWFPTASDVILRKGSEAHVTGIVGEVETLSTYKPEDGDEVLFAFANSAIYDVSAAGAVGAAAVSGLASNRWITSNMATAGGNFLLCVNGADDMELFDGAAWTAITGASSPAITGPSTDDLAYVTVHKERAWYLEVDTLTAWYAAAGAFAGALSEFPMQAVFKQGGYLMAMGTWTIDGGQGIDDLAVFVTSEGEVAIYQGTNPSNAASWALVGIYNLGKPIGRRCLQKLAGDLLLITTDGVLPLSKALIGRENEAAAITDTIQGAMAAAVNRYKAEFGWELTHFPEGNMLILNVPVTTGQEQFVMNTYTGAWADFLGWNANCFAEFDGELYFGGSTVVDKAWSGASDKGAPVRGDLVESFGYLKDPTSLKELKLMRPTFRRDFAPDVLKVGANVDYNVVDPTSQITDTSTGGALWGVALWGSAVWGASERIDNEWYAANGIGYAVATHIIVENSISTDFAYLNNLILYERGGVM